MDGLFESPLVQTAIAVVSVWFVAALVCSGVVQLAAFALSFKAKHLWLAFAQLLSKPNDEGTPTEAPARPEGEARGLRNRAADSKVLLPTVKATPPNSMAGALQLLERTVDPRRVPDAEAFQRFVGTLPGVTEDTMNRVSSIDRQSAVEALVVAARGDDAAATAIQGDFEETPLGKLVKTLPAAVKDDATQLQAWFDGWFDGQMEQLSTRYRTKIRWYTAFVGLVLAIFLHVDSMAIARELYSTPTTRQVVIAQVEQIGSEGSADAVGCEQEDPKAQLECIREYVTALESFDVAPGWRAWTTTGGPPSWQQLLGVLTTAGAIAAGAPFWFDVLRRLMGLKPKPKDPSPAPLPPATVTLVTASAD